MYYKSVIHFWCLLISVCVYSKMLCSDTDMPIIHENGIAYSKIIGTSKVVENNVLKTSINSSDTQGGRSYFGSSCNSSLEYSPSYYMSLSLLNKTMSFDVNLLGVGCGCNAAIYLTSMYQNTEKGNCDSDYYCDANSICGVACTEIDLMEANMYSFHSTIHGTMDPFGATGGYGGGDVPNDYDPLGWNGPRDFTKEMYKPDSSSSCIDTSLKFTVSASFPTDESGVLNHIEMELSQWNSVDEKCSISFTVGESSYLYMNEVSLALSEGMTPIVSYWKGDMLWMDGIGADGLGPCDPYDTPNCENGHFELSNFNIYDQTPLIKNISNHTEPGDLNIYHSGGGKPSEQVLLIATLQISAVILSILLVTLLIFRPSLISKSCLHIRQRYSSVPLEGSMRHDVELSPLHNPKVLNFDDLIPERPKTSNLSSAGTPVHNEDKINEESNEKHKNNNNKKSSRILSRNIQPKAEPEGFMRFI